MLPDRTRLWRRAATPRYLRLARALKQLESTVTVMNTGAHPDDEQTGLLAWFSLHEGMRVIIACSTRGEGGQNSLGPERGAALGLVRSRELEEAARAINADVAWLGHGPVDPVHDFGFSKNGKDTLERWGRDRVIERLVRAYRAHRPDIVIPTFLDVPGQHGHHRAMTEAAEAAVALAADPAYVIEGLAPWDGIKYYLPAWSGGGETYDDELPPPPETVVIRAIGKEQASGMSYERLGEVSRAYHASQGMGHWGAPRRAAWGLHFKTPESSVTEGLPSTLASLAQVAGAPAALADAAEAIAEASAAFPNNAALCAALLRASKALEAKGTEEFESAHGHRIARKKAEITEALALAAELEITASLEGEALLPGTEASVLVEIDSGRAKLISLALAAPEGIDLIGQEEAELGQRLQLSVARSLSPASRYLPGFSSLGGNGLLHVTATFELENQRFTLPVDLEEEVILRPAKTVQPSVDGLILNTRTGAAAGFELEGALPEGLTITAPDGLSVQRRGQHVEIGAGQIGAGKHRLSLDVAGSQAWQSRGISYGHIGRLAHVTPAVVDVLAIDLEVPEVRVGYVGGGADRAGLWLKRMGADVTELDAAAFSHAKDTGFAEFDTIVIGIFTFGLRPDLAAATAELRAWVHEGGNLITLYHRPWDNWKPEETTPAKMVVGAPSLRWRVTRPDVPVTILAPEHPLLAGPNPISHADFEGWDKERGLYFLSSWDEVYEPLLAMADPDEQPLLGSLVTGRIGKGRHTHTSLVLHHQMDRLVPGAFRLMANLIARP